MRTIVSKEDIATRVAALGRQLSADYQGSNPLLVGVLKGSYVFLADLSRAIDVPHEIDFLAVSSYGKSTQAGAFRLLKDLSADVEGRHVVVVEDICDTGLSLRAVRDIIGRRRPASLSLCVLLDKPSRRQVQLAPEYVGFSIPDVFVVGYGLDYAEGYRYLPYVAALEPADLGEDSGRHGEITRG